MSVLHGPCAKRRTQAVLYCTDGKTYAAENVCLNPQTVCPRETGEGYTKCKSICQQVGHSEAMVIAMAGSSSVGATMHVSHWYACDSCAAIIKAAGVAEVVFTSPVDSERTAKP